MDESSTYLEDFLVALEVLPNPVRRDCELVRELDKEVSELSRRLIECEQQFALVAEQLQLRTAELSSLQLSSPSSSTVAALAATAAAASVSAPTPSTSRKRTRSVSAPVPDAVPAVGSAGCESSEEQPLKLEVQRLEEQRDALSVELVDLQSRAVQRIAEKSAMTRQLLQLVQKVGTQLDADLSSFAVELKNSGEYDAPRGLPVDSEVAFYVEPNGSGPSASSHSAPATATATGSGDHSEETALILGRILCHRSEISSYEILDVDDDQQRYLLPEAHVFPLGQADAVKRVSKGDILFAMYPDSTSFYAAIVVSAPRRATVAAAEDPMVTVQFVGDEDGSGSVPQRSVSLRHLVRAPQLL